MKYDINNINNKITGDWSPYDFAFDILAFEIKVYLQNWII